MAFRTIGTAASLLACIAAVSAQPTPATAFTTELELRDPQVVRRIEQVWNEKGREGHFTGARQVRIAFRSFRQPDLTTEEGAIVIVSGRTESMLKYKELAYDLWRHGYSVYLHDHRGQGLSGREPEVEATPEKGHVDKFEHYVTDLRQFVRTEVAAGGHARSFLLAHSMGGAIAALFVEAGGPEVQGLKAVALSSPMLEIRGVAGLGADWVSCNVAEAIVKRGHGTDFILMGGPYAPKDFKDNQYTHSLVRYERLLAQVRADPTIKLGSPTHGWFANACGAAARARSQAEKIGTPVLLLVAGEDSIVHPNGPKDFCKDLSKVAPTSGCDGRGGGPITIADARHEMLIERDDIRTPVLRQILAFYRAAGR